MRRRAQRGGQRIAQQIMSRRWYGLWVLVMALLIVMSFTSAHTARAAHADTAAGSMHVVVPAPSSDNKTVQGTVGTNVSVSASQATAGANYSLGWAAQSDGCATGFTAFTDGTTSVTADDTGAFSATFVWPDAANTPGALYLICAQDTANPTTDVFAADQVFQVLDGNAPSIALAQAPSSSQSGDGFAAGGPVQVQGKDFLPQGTTVDIFVTSNSSFTSQDFQPDNALKTQDGSPITSDSQGQFSAVVTLPKIITGNLYIYAVSTDAVTTGSTPFLPSLVASTTIRITAPQATPTATAQPASTATPKVTGGGHPTTKKPVDHSKRIVAIAALGGLSLILFILGAILIASATIGPRNPPAFDGVRSQPDAIRSGQPW